MKSVQPKFEQVKTLFYQSFVNSEKANNAILMQSLGGKLMAPFNSRKDTFKKDFNNWLDHIDIRQAGTLIDILKEYKIKMPGWMKNKAYSIDYNQNEALDLIPN